jgi:hypothetical protein
MLRMPLYLARLQVSLGVMRTRSVKYYWMNRPDYALVSLSPSRRTRHER